MNPGPLARKRETLRNDLFLSNFTIDFLQKKNANLNLNNFNGGGAQEHLKKSVNCPVLYPPPNIISFD